MGGRQSRRVGLALRSPVPGYHAPPEATTAAGSRIPILVLGLLADAELERQRTTRR